MMGGLALVGTLPADVFDITGVRRASAPKAAVVTTALREPEAEADTMVDGWSMDDAWMGLGSAAEPGIGCWALRLTLEAEAMDIEVVGCGCGCSESLSSS